jgi:ketosteroid isomerase-like protein
VGVIDEQVVRDTWDAVSRGELEPLERLFAPDAKWRAVEDGEWNCENRARIIEVLRDNRAAGLTGSVEEVFELDGRLIVAFRPEYRPNRDGWPLDNGIRYIVLSIRDGLVSEMKGCADRASALEYASAGES